MVKKPVVELGFFLDSIIKMQIELDHIADNRAHYMMVVAGVVLTLSLIEVGISTVTQLGFLILVISSMFTIILSLIAIRPRIWHSKCHNPTNVMFYSSIVKNFTRKDYMNKVLKITNNRENIIKEYSDECYSHALVLKDKFIFLRKTTTVMILGLLLGSAVVVYGMFFV
jgi:hypothetical protein